MNQLLRGAKRPHAAGAALLTVLIAAAAVRVGRAQEGPPPTEGTASSETPETVIQKWPEGARLTAGLMLAKYGEPTRWSEGALIWIANGPWEKTVVYRTAWRHYVGKRDKDYLEQTTAYKVPKEKIEDLKRFDRMLDVDAAHDRLTARSESESMNFLTLNLADEIVTGRRSVEEAREVFQKVEQLSKSGKSSAYMEGLLFPKPADSEKPLDQHFDTQYDLNDLP